jgi:chromosome segregation ATPase
MKCIFLLLLCAFTFTACGSGVKPSSTDLVRKFSMNAELAENVTKMQKEIEQATKDLTATNSKAASVEIRIEELKNKRVLTDETIVLEIEATNKKKSALQAELGTLKAQLTASATPAARASIQSQIDAGEATNDKLTQQIDEQRAALQAARQIEEQDAQSIVDMINDTQGSYNTTLQTLNSKKAKHLQIVGQLQESKDTNSKLSEISQSLLAINSHMQSDLAAAQDQIVVLKEQLAALQASYEDLRISSAETAGRLDEVSGQLGSARAEVDELQKQVNRLSAERDIALAAQREAERRYAVAEAARKQAEAARQRLAQENAALRQELAAARAAAAN